MSDPSLSLQGWIVSTLKTAATDAGNDVYDRVPQSNPFPRITLGPRQMIPGEDDGQCRDTFEVFQQIDVWSRAVGFPEVKRIASQIKSALHNATVTLTGFDVILFEWRSTSYRRDPDGLTNRAIMQFRAIIDEA